MHAIYANVTGDRVFRDGAKIVLITPPDGGNEACNAYGMSRGGRRVEKWVRVCRLTNPRAQYAPEHILEKAMCFESPDDTYAVQWLERLAEGGAKKA